MSIGQWTETESDLKWIDVVLQQREGKSMLEVFIGRKRYMLNMPVFKVTLALEPIAHHKWSNFVTCGTLSRLRKLG